MSDKTQFGFTMLALLAASSLLPAQNPVSGQRLNRRPATQTTPSATTPPAAATSAIAASNPAPTPQPATPASQPPRKATVSYTAKQLTVVASNSSLNQILRDISRAADIQVTGGVAEERVFGTYGPGTPLEVLSALLDGTGTNMFLIEGSGDRRSELVLTPRNGGPTPPNPNASSFESDSTQAQEETGQEDPNSPHMPEPTTSVVTPEAQGAAQVPAIQGNGAPAQAAAPVAQPSGDSTSAPSQPASTNTTDQQSPNGVKTPQQIFEELMRRRQQQQQPQ